MVSDEILSSAKILIVDDDVALLSLYQTVLKTAGFTNLHATSDPRGVLARFVEDEPDLLILDIRMPHINGLQLLQLLQSNSRAGVSLPILVVTASATQENRHGALVGGAVEFIEKPFHIGDFLLLVRNLLKLHLAVREVQLQNRALVQQLVERTEELAQYQADLKEAQLEVIARLARAGEQRDDDTGQHTQRVALISGLIAQGLGLDQGCVELIQRAAPLHDVGKIGIPDSILLKPGKLTNEEFGCMQRHCQFGSDLLAGGRSDLVQLAERIALSHHEKWNGRGYPFGLAGQSIPIEGRILAVADVFDALTHERPYKRAWPVAEAVAEIKAQAGQQFDPAAVEAFLALPHAELL